VAKVAVESKKAPNGRAPLALNIRPHLQRTKNPLSKWRVVGIWLVGVGAVAGTVAMISLAVRKNSCWSWTRQFSLSLAG
jgi:hypothetical protein